MAQTVLLGPDHETANFDCGREDQNDFIRHQAVTAARLGTSQTHVLLDGRTVVAFYALATWQIRPAEATAAVVAEMPEKRSIPAVLLAQLGVSRDLQGKGIGAALVKEAVLRTCEAANTIGIRALALHAAEPGLITFYRGLGFESCSEKKPEYMMARLVDLKAALSAK